MRHSLSIPLRCAPLLYVAEARCVAVRPTVAAVHCLPLLVPHSMSLASASHGEADACPISLRSRPPLPRWSLLPLSLPRPIPGRPYSQVVVSLTNGRLTVRLIDRYTESFDMLMTLQLGVESFTQAPAAPPAPPDPVATPPHHLRSTLSTLQ